MLQLERQKVVRLLVATAIIFAAQAWAAQPSKEVKIALRQIPTAAGGNALDRMRACGITFADGSWIEPAANDIPEIGAKSGDTVLEAYINIPPMPEAGTLSAYSDVLARWVIHKGVAFPAGGWAKAIQTDPYPMPSFPWLHC